MKKIIYWFLVFSLVLVGCSSSTSTTTETTSKSKKKNVAKTYESFLAASEDDEVKVDGYIQAIELWWNNEASVFIQNEDVAYFIYNMTCTSEEYAELEVGMHIKVDGYKAVWHGENEIVDANYSIKKKTKVYEPVDITDQLESEDLINYQNRFVSFTNMQVTSAGRYGWDGSGESGDDIYFEASYNGKSYTFVMENYLTDCESDVYKKAMELQVGQIVNLQGFLYWYDGMNPQITNIEVVS